MANSVAFGFYTAKDFFSMRVVDYGIPVANSMVQASFDLYTRQINAMLSRLTARTTDHQRRYAMPGSGFMQPIADDGNPDVVVEAGVYDIGLPMRMFAHAWGTNRISRAKMTIEDYNRLTMSAMLRDSRTLDRYALAAIFTNVNYTYVDDKYGSITVRPAANGDDVQYVGGNGESATANHYTAQAAAISNTDDPYTALTTLLDASASNTGDKFAYIATNLVNATTTLADFYPARDSNIIYGTGVSTANVTVTTDDPVTNSSLAGFGDKLLGYHESGTYIVQKKSLPSGYIVAIADGADPVLAMREEPETDLQGLFPEYQDVDGNHQVNRVIRRCGMAVQNRAAVAVRRIGNASYAIPTGYDARSAVFA